MVYHMGKEILLAKKGHMGLKEECSSEFMCLTCSQQVSSGDRDRVETAGDSPGVEDGWNSGWQTCFTD